MALLISSRRKEERWPRPNISHSVRNLHRNRLFFLSDFVNAPLVFTKVSRWVIVFLSLPAILSSPNPPLPPLFPYFSSLPPLSLSSLLSVLFYLSLDVSLLFHDLFYDLIFSLFAFSFCVSLLLSLFLLFVILLPFLLLLPSLCPLFYLFYC